VRRGEHFFGRNIGVADDAVVGGGGAAYPFMAIGEPDRQIGAGSGVMQRMEPLRVQPFELNPTDLVTGRVRLGENNPRA